MNKRRRYKEKQKRYIARRVLEMQEQYMRPAVNAIVDNFRHDPTLLRAIAAMNYSQSEL